MKKTSDFPLLIVFLWHPAEERVAKPIVDYCVTKLSRDRSNLFSHTINIPIRFCTSKDNQLPQYDWKMANADKVLLFCFSGSHLINSTFYGCDWVSYVKDRATDNVEFIGIALDTNGYKLFPDKNFIRMNDYVNDKNICERVFLAIAHRIYRNGLEKDKVKIFLSHAKADAYAVDMAKEIKSYIDARSDMRSFFDVTSIEVGTNFDTEIDKGIKDSSFVAIKSDHYSGSYWCQKEVIKAHEYEVPYIVVDMLQKYEDRSFPYLTNCPVIRVEKEHDELAVLRILECILLESIRTEYVLKQLKRANAAYAAHPPALYELLKMKKRKSFYYPYPDIYEDERELLLSKYKEVKTPKSDNREIWNNVRVGISISGPDSSDLLSAGIDENHLTRLSVELAGYFVGNNAKVIYGGDFRQNGFTRYLRDEAEVQKNRLHIDEPVCTNYVAWPYSIKSKDDDAQWMAGCYGTMTLECVSPPSDVDSFIEDKNKQVYKCQNVERYVKTRCLTEMRNKMIKSSDIRISAGGKITGYSGIMPGVLEEVLIAIKEEKPLYLLGGFGGITEKICKMMLDKKIPDELNEEWQKNHIHMCEEEARMFVGVNKNLPDYTEIKSLLKIENLNNGLSDKENKILFVTPSIEIIIDLIAKGYKSKKITK